MLPVIGVLSQAKTVYDLANSAYDAVRSSDAGKRVAKEVKDRTDALSDLDFDFDTDAVLDPLKDRADALAATIAQYRDDLTGVTAKKQARRRKGWLTALGVGAGLAAVGGAVYWFVLRQEHPAPAAQAPTVTQPEQDQQPVVPQKVMTSEGEFHEDAPAGDAD